MIFLIFLLLREINTVFKKKEDIETTTDEGLTIKFKLLTKYIEYKCDHALKQKMPRLTILVNRYTSVYLGFMKYLFLVSIGLILFF